MRSKCQWVVIPSGSEESYTGSIEERFLALLEMTKYERRYTIYEIRYTNDAMPAGRQEIRGFYAFCIRRNN
ncbi:MAG: hypothetical protein ABII25_01090 [bacterium]